MWYSDPTTVEFHLVLGWVFPILQLRKLMGRRSRTQEQQLGTTDVIDVTHSWYRLLLTVHPHPITCHRCNHRAGVKDFYRWSSHLLRAVHHIHPWISHPSTIAKCWLRDITSFPPPMVAWDIVRLVLVHICICDWFLVVCENIWGTLLRLQHSSSCGGSMAYVNMMSISSPRVYIRDATSFRATSDGW